MRRLWPCDGGGVLVCWEHLIRAEGAVKLLVPPTNPTRTPDSLRGVKAPSEMTRWPLCWDLVPTFLATSPGPAGHTLPWLPGALLSCNPFVHSLPLVSVAWSQSSMLTAVGLALLAACLGRLVASERGLCVFVD